MSPTLFKVVVVAVIRHWVKVVAETRKGVEGLDLFIRYLAAYFYANNGIVALTQPEMLQRSFDLLTGLFDQVGLHINTRKVASMDFHP